MQAVDNVNERVTLRFAKNPTASFRNGELGNMVPMSVMASNTLNPIRRMVDQIKMEPNSTKKMIPLSIGDPTIFGNMKCADVVTEAVVEAVRSRKYNGYAPATGIEEAREAVAKYSSCHNYNLTSKDIVITSGCSSALEYCILALANPGQNILIPRPAFPLYITISRASGIECKYYNLLPEEDWNVDVDHMESVIDEKTVAILINSPSNPCGSVYTRQHLSEILNVAERHHLPVIADEIYSFFTFDDVPFEFLASINSNVSVLSCSGITKRFLCPGWRIGWIAIYDHYGRFGEIRQALADLATRTVGANTIVQGALPTILTCVENEEFQATLSIVKENLDIATAIISACPGLQIVKPKGAMYAMVEVKIELFPSFASNKDFMINMVKEESVFCLPSEPFGIDNYFRMLLTVPPEVMREACERIKAYCIRHYQKKNELNL